MPKFLFGCSTKLISCAVSGALALSSLIVPQVNVSADELRGETVVTSAAAEPDTSVSQTTTAPTPEGFTTTTTTAPQDVPQETGVGFRVTVVDGGSFQVYEGYEPVPGVEMKFIKITGYDSPDEAVKAGDYEVLDEWTSDDLRLYGHVTPLMTREQIDENAFYCLYAPELPEGWVYFKEVYDGERYTDVEQDYVLSPNLLNWLPLGNEYRVELRHYDYIPESYPAEGTFSIDLTVFDMYTSEKIDVAQFLLTKGTSDERVVEFETENGTAHVDGIPYYFWQKSQNYSQQFKLKLRTVTGFYVGVKDFVLNANALSCESPNIELTAYIDSTKVGEPVTTIPGTTTTRYFYTYTNTYTTTAVDKSFTGEPDAYYFVGVDIYPTTVAYNSGDTLDLSGLRLKCDVAEQVSDDPRDGYVHSTCNIYPNFDPDEVTAYSSQNSIMLEAEDGTIYNYDEMPGLPDGGYVVRVEVLEYSGLYDVMFQYGISIGDAEVPVITTATSTRVPADVTVSTTTTVSHEVVTSTTSTPASVPVPGDANGDGEVNMADAVAIMRLQADPDEFALTEQGRRNADVSGGGDGVTNADALAIQQYEAGILVTLSITE
ncbi:MAG: dockerin type I repeat-containing protein [Ruminococcus sp.]|nr:dockerin type I repeat-containing protein [Ruminococcus sp.]